MSKFPQSCSKKILKCLARRGEVFIAAKAEPIHGFKMDTYGWDSPVSIYVHVQISVVDDDGNEYDECDEYDNKYDFCI